MRITRFSEQSGDDLDQLLVEGYRLPRHVAIIMDGNGRWAKRRGLPRAAGHREGVKSVHAVVEAAGDLGIDVLTLYTFSKENWQRPADEVSTLMKLLAISMRREINELHQKNVQVRAIGDLDDLPFFAYDEIAKSIERTKNNTGLILNLALSYGGRSEIVDATRNIARKIKEGLLDPEDIDENCFQSHLYNGNLPDPDLLIRTSGEQRISNFLLWQLAYSELYITPCYWPDFRKDEFIRALLSYMKRERRFGMVSEQVAK